MDWYHAILRNNVNGELVSCGLWAVGTAPGPQPPVTREYVLENAHHQGPTWWSLTPEARAVVSKKEWDEACAASHACATEWYAEQGDKVRLPKGWL